jgi:integrase/recombinase XerD
MSELTSLPVPTFSSPLADAVSRFLAFKRAAGCRYDDEARALRLLDQFLTTTLNPDDPVITLDVVRRYVARRGEESETTRAHRLSLIRQVCRFLALEQPRTAVPAPRFLGIHCRPFVARVMSLAEGRRFLTACEHLETRPWSPIRDTVLGTALVLLYFTGLRTGEVLRLTIADVDLVGTREHGMGMRALSAAIAAADLASDDRGAEGMFRICRIIVRWIVSARTSGLVAAFA